MMEAAKRKPPEGLTCTQMCCEAAASPQTGGGGVLVLAFMGRKGSLLASSKSRRQKQKQPQCVGVKFLLACHFCAISRIDGIMHGWLLVGGN